MCTFAHCQFVFSPTLFRISFVLSVFYALVPFQFSFNTVRKSIKKINILTHTSKLFYIRTHHTKNEILGCFRFDIYEHFYKLTYIKRMTFDKWWFTFINIISAHFKKQFVWYLVELFSVFPFGNYNTLFWLFAEK